jgi:hypothetical protein
MAGYAGFNWIGVELEERFVEMGNANLALHAAKWLGLGEVSCVKLLQGDSRQFARIVGAAVGVVTSPPYSDGLGRGGGPSYDALTEEKSIASADYGTTPGQIGNLPAGKIAGVVASPPYGGNANSDKTQDAREERRGFTQGKGGFRSSEAYGVTPGQIGGLPTGSIDGAVLSPPYADSINNDRHGIDYSKSKPDYPGRQMTEERAASHEQKFEEQSYGSTAGQIGALQPGSLDAVVGSPPFAECRTDGGGIAITGDTNTKKLGRSSVAGVITSPPYAESIKGDHKEQETAKESHAARTDPGQGGPLGKSQRFGGYGATAGNIGNLKEGKVGAVVTSPPFAACDTKPTKMGMGKATRADGDSAGRNKGDYHYGASVGQIGVLKVGDLCNVQTAGQASVEGQDGVNDATKRTSDDQGVENQRNTDKGSGRPTTAFRTPNKAEKIVSTGGAGVDRGEGLVGVFSGEAPLKGTGVDVCVAGQPQNSPSITSLSQPNLTVNGITASPTLKLSAEVAIPKNTPNVANFSSSSAAADTAEPHSTPKQCAQKSATTASVERDPTLRSMDVGERNSEPETYWVAMGVVYRECFTALRPGGYAAIVVKDYVKDKARAPLCDQTLQLLTAIGFEPVERIHAMLVKETTREGLFETVTKKTERKSFFRRLAEKKGSPRIDWEEVIIVRKPGGAA